MTLEPAAAILIASTNAGKRAEYRRLLPEYLEIVSLGEYPARLPAEDGPDYATIAAAKALAASSQTGLLAIGDDSGLEVDALGGAPGLQTARFAGDPPSDERNRALLLRRLRGVPAPRRTATFRCAVALAAPHGIIAVTEGSCTGRIGPAEAGAGGFGYDPLFVLADGRTLAELAPDEKDRVSHRGHACRALLPHLLGAIANEQGGVR